MTLLQIKFLFIFVISFLVENTLISQNLATDTSSSGAAKSTLSLYNTAFHQQLNLYNGKEYKDYLHPFEQGQPYFLTKEWSKGTVDYYGAIYDDVSILYDLIADEVIILSYNNISKINLFKDRLNAFSVSGHSFINIAKDSVAGTGLTAGFYDVLSKGKVTLLAKRTKNIQSYITQIVELKIFEKDHLFLKKNTEYFTVNNKKSLLKQLGDKRAELQKFAKQNKLKFGKSPENSINKLVEYYNQIIK